MSPLLACRKLQAQNPPFPDDDWCGREWSGTVSVAEGGFLGVDMLVPIEGTSANITSTLAGSLALRDFSANVIAVSYTLTGLAPNSDFGLRVERDTSCSLAIGARKGEMYDEELYGAGDNASPWNGGWHMFVVCCWRIGFGVGSICSGCEFGLASV